MQTPFDRQSFSALDKDDLIALLIQQNEILVAQSARIAGLVKEIEELKGQLINNNCNSSKPPSSDGYDKLKPKSQRKKSGRPSGGQPGHKGNTLKQVEYLDHIHEHAVSHCVYCHVDLSNQAVITHEARQIFDLPEIKMAVTDEHRAQIKTCSHCDTRVKIEFPASVTQPVQYGNGVCATATYLSQYQQLERFEDSAKELLRTSEVAHFDESGIRLKKTLNWLHVASTEQLSCYHIDPKRRAVATDAMAILPVFSRVRDP